MHVTRTPRSASPSQLQSRKTHSDPQECQTILDVFFDLGHRELDTARVYCGGTTEEVGILCVLGSWKKLGILEGRYGRLRAFIWSKRLSLTRSDEASPSPYAE